MAQLSLPLLPVELVVLHGWGIQLCLCSKAVGASVVVGCAVVFVSFVVVGFAVVVCTDVVAGCSVVACTTVVVVCTVIDGSSVTVVNVSNIVDICVVCSSNVVISSNDVFTSVSLSKSASLHAANEHIEFTTAIANSKVHFFFCCFIIFPAFLMNILFPQNIPIYYIIQLKYIKGRISLAERFLFGGLSIQQKSASRYLLKHSLHMYYISSVESFLK